MRALVSARKRVAWGVVALLLASMLAACGSPTSTGGNTSGGNTSAPQAGGGQSASTPGGAHITKPFDRTVTGAQCFAGTGANKGKAAFGFPDRDASTAALSFSLGPLADGYSPGQENNKPYTGAGSYSNIGIVVRPENGQPVIGFGVVTVNSDLRTGAFQLNDGSASGTWDCGMAVTP